MKQSQQPVKKEITLITLFNSIVKITNNKSIINNKFKSLKEF